MFQFAVSEVLCILVVCTAVMRFHSPHLKIMEMVSSGSQTCFTSNKHVAQSMLEVLLTAVSDYLQCKGCYYALILQHTWVKTAKIQIGTTKPQSPVYYTVAQNTL